MLADPRGHENQVEKACEVKHNLRWRGDQGLSFTFFLCILKWRIIFMKCHITFAQLVSTLLHSGDVELQVRLDEAAVRMLCSK